ncbi:DUF3710 domain-containing protein [Gephyromycinifex aptenodytis]|uniref:DUF3710 domain-containing protein n=1 Tax=Gephyromycinifex aptenodytis TaxID=2716227 RepID=UPI0014475AA6|nr:DUF3710 domain-containing protein [Gephyromycinifex aptenodytis]
MAWFRRGKARDAQTAPVETDAAQTPAPPVGDDVESATAAQTQDEASAQAPAGEAVIDESKLGPWDSSEVPGKGEFLKLGALWLPVIQGLMISFEMDEAQTQVTAVRVMLGDSALQLQAFAAPRSRGLWDEIRTELAEGITSSGGTAQERQGPLGPELFVQVPAQDATGRPTTSSMLFVGFDGPRWFLRGVLSGSAATDERAAEPLRNVMRVVVVDRGEAPMAPRELLELQLPDESPEGQPEPGGKDFDPFARGPEITEVR